MTTGCFIWLCSICVYMFCACVFNSNRPQSVYACGHVWNHQNRMIMECVTEIFFHVYMCVQTARQPKRLATGSCQVWFKLVWLNYSSVRIMFATVWHIVNYFKSRWTTKPVSSGSLWLQGRSRAVGRDKAGLDLHIHIYPLPKIRQGSKITSKIFYIYTCIFF